MRTIKKKYSIILFVIINAARLFAQTEPALSGENAPVIPAGYNTITLGIGIEELKEALKRDTANYIFREDRDVYFVPLRNENYVETTGRGFIKRAFFQLKDSSVFIISLELNTDRLDYYSVWTTFAQKYGEPLSIDPQKAVWEDERVRVSIERPLTIKYIDRAVFDDIISQSEAGASAASVLRDEFLRGF